MPLRIYYSDKQKWITLWPFTGNWITEWRFDLDNAIVREDPEWWARDDPDKGR